MVSQKDELCTTVETNSRALRGVGPEIIASSIGHAAGEEFAGHRPIATDDDLIIGGDQRSRLAGNLHGDIDDSFARPDWGTCPIFPSPWPARIWRAGRTCRPDGTRTRRRTTMANQRTDAPSLASCQSFPGPLAIQVGIYISYLRGACAGGIWRAWTGGWAFILPNFVVVAGFGAL
jgi:hypothetical protein